MKKQNIDIVTDNKGSCSIICGLVDIPGRKFYPWSIWSLAHLSKGKLILFSSDMPELHKYACKHPGLCDTRKASAKRGCGSGRWKYSYGRPDEKEITHSEELNELKYDWYILGLPCPSLFPLMIDRVKDDMKDWCEEDKIDLVAML